jgi:hypothetical protein
MYRRFSGNTWEPRNSRQERITKDGNEHHGPSTRTAVWEFLMAQCERCLTLWGSCLCPVAPAIYTSSSLQWTVVQWQQHSYSMCMCIISWDTSLKETDWVVNLTVVLFFEKIADQINTLTCVWVTTDGVLIGNWIYWPLRDHNYK